MNTEEIEIGPADTDRTHASLIPDWAPWGVLSGLLALGLAGGLGFIPVRLSVTPRVSATSDGTSAKRAAAPTSTVRVTLKDVGASRRTSGLAAPASDEAKVSVAHLVVSHKDTSLGAHRKIARTKEEARWRAEEALARAKKGEDFGKLVAEFSDEPGGAERGGKFGKFRHRDAVKPFADAAFALKPGEISPLVESAFGFHVIRRTE